MDLMQAGRGVCVCLVAARLPQLYPTLAAWTSACAASCAEGLGHRLCCEACTGVAQGKGRAPREERERLCPGSSTLLGEALVPLGLMP